METKNESGISLNWAELRKHLHASATTPVDPSRNSWVPDGHWYTYAPHVSSEDSGSVVYRRTAVDEHPWGSYVSGLRINTSESSTTPWQWAHDETLKEKLKDFFISMMSVILEVQAEYETPEEKLFAIELLFADYLEELLEIDKNFLPEEDN